MTIPTDLESPTPPPSLLDPARLCFVKTLGLLLLSLAPLPVGWARARSALDSARSPALNRADRDLSAGGYYQGLIGVSDGPSSSRPDDVAMRLLGKPAEWTRFHAANVCNPLPDQDFLQFELKPNLDKTLFGHPFTTNSHGMRDRECSVAKPPGAFRIALLGSSIDMGWGIASEDSYVSLLEDWLNAHARRVGLDRRFEVLNFAVAAYSPLQRLETFRRKVLAFEPDLVVYSATTLDNRLAEIHLCDLFRAHSDLQYDFVRESFARAGLTASDVATDYEDRLLYKDFVKKKLRTQLWPLYDATMGELAADCRSEGLPLACLIVPRVGKSDAPMTRSEPVARLLGIAAHHAIPIFDLSPAFDDDDSETLALASWDDHPNAAGHRRLFLHLSRALVNDPSFYRLLFPTGPASASN
jgi:hypothetical protein